jgi:hypothetical protein
LFLERSNLREAANEPLGLPGWSSAPVVELLTTIGKIRLQVENEEERASWIPSDTLYIGVHLLELRLRLGAVIWPPFDLKHHLEWGDNRKVG